ncbi:MAG: hypothetical protein K2L12_03680 [Clostridia bacterium]|nr:hypothetical protein [Clostridia bacterium]
MKIEIKEENYKQLVQCVYLGNLVINGYRKVGEEKEEYSKFTQNLLSQFAAALPDKPKYKFVHMPNEKSDDARLSDLNNLIDDSVKEFYVQHLKDAFCEIFDCIC